MAEPIVVGETADGQPYTLPIEELLTGRQFITGKSGAGKSNSASVIIEELLERGHPILVVDVDGEYWGLREAYEVLHVGATDDCHLQVGAEHAAKIAELALEQRVPIILDVSGYVHADEADELVREVAHELFVREHDLMRPFLMLVEEIHEYIPQRGSLDETGEMLIRVAKRGRKRGLGLAGLSQRPAAVDKDFITQADLVVWHRLTWENDVDVVRKILGADYADAISSLADGEAFVQADWAEADVERVQFKRKQTFDAGEAPGLEEVDAPELVSVDADLVDELGEISERHERRQDRIAQLEARLEAKDEAIADLEEDLEDARDLQRLGEAFVDAARSSGDGGVEVEQQELLEEKNDEIAQLRERLDERQDEVNRLQVHVDDLQDENERLRDAERRIEQAERIEEQLDQAREVLGVDVEAAVDGPAADRRLEALREHVDELEAENEQLREELTGAAAQSLGKPLTDLASMVAHESVQTAVETAIGKTDIAERHFHRVLSILANTEDGGPLTAREIAPLTDVGDSAIHKVCKALHQAGVLSKSQKERASAWALDREFLETRIEVAEQQARMTQ